MENTEMKPLDNKDLDILSSSIISYIYTTLGEMAIAYELNGLYNEKIEKGRYDLSNIHSMLQRSLDRINFMRESILMGRLVKTDIYIGSILRDQLVKVAENNYKCNGEGLTNITVKIKWNKSNNKSDRYCTIIVTGVTTQFKVIQHKNGTYFISGVQPVDFKEALHLGREYKRQRKERLRQLYAKSKI